MSIISMKPFLLPLYVSSDRPVSPKGPSENSSPAQDALPSWKKLGAYTKFSELLARDTDRGVLTPAGKELLDTVISPGLSNAPKVNVLSFGVGGVDANDMFFVRRDPVIPGSTNIVLYMPENDFKSFYEFKSTKEMQAFLKTLPKTPAAFSAFLAHFGRDVNSDAVRSVVKSMNEWASGPDNTKPKMAMGGSSYIFGNVFERQERLSQEPVNPIFVNGLTDLQHEWVSPRGFAVYSGKRPDGELVLYKYDTAGNLTGLGDKGNYYFVEDGLRRRAPLVPLTAEQYSAGLEKEVLKNLDDGGLEGLLDVLRPFVPPTDEAITTSAETQVWNYKDGALGLLKQGLGAFLENPFFWTSEFLELLGVSKDKAGFVERTLDNPVTSLLKYANKYNDLGKRFGKTKAEMDKAFEDIGNTLQAAIPVYGQVRGVGSWGAKAIENGPVTDKNLNDAAGEFQNRP
ncbi:dermonecrotic toxin domain-containing protein [Pseudomonas costantinii]|uniref:dermonecrotic toxin domain-containing protein n=1 Tax=Pseudomonas costantinii TaxID=168469 RepID=UPI0015A01690|nr:DUF6543 domain-containing protein [Pseudomonas costantinii]NVZ69195.1 hypothetical protein [Pseudomonas costantinii]